jgi:hydrogenase maturation protein HypF
VLAEPSTSVRRRLVARGVVQGVGFRPFVHKLATGLGLAGFVGNDSDSVFVEVEGADDRVATFSERLLSDLPPLAVVESVETFNLAVTDAPGFVIVESRRGATASTLVPADVATCDECLAEVCDPNDRRYRYPFTNCTNCGPRFTIITGLPYDRPATTMAGFSMCPACDREYHDPANRRFHAQPNACPVCGPRLTLVSTSAGVGSGVLTGDSALLEAQQMLAAGGIVAMKGIGGFHLACDARDPDTVGRLRSRKGRADKPFALLAADVASVERIAHIGPGETSALCSRARSIVLLARRADADVAHNVAPRSSLVGVMLPSTPLHHLLLHPPPGGGPWCDLLVMTSGNLTEEPIAVDNDEALERLGGLADAMLFHDRGVHLPCDDSVVRCFRGAELPVRRSRGYAPLPLRLDAPVRPVLAVGGELKATFCLANGNHAWLSQHVGDMGNLETIQAFERSVERFRAVYATSPEVVACDAHPGYHSARWAEAESGRLGVPLVRVQHHHAHVASLLAEQTVPTGPVIGIAFDGTGYGPDGAIWGGEVLIADLVTFRRAAHLRYVPLPGGDATIARPYRAALAHLHAAGVAWDARLAPVAACPVAERAVLERQLQTGFGCVATSSMGRLFDAVAAIAGCSQLATYEAQAAMELEALAAANGPGDGYRFDVGPGGIIDAAPVVAAVAADAVAGVDAGRIAAGFHDAVAEMITRVASGVRARDGLTTVGLTGGVFQNIVLSELAVGRLEDAGFTVLVHRKVPPNDGGLSLGQAVIAGSTVATECPIGTKEGDLTCA